MPTDTATINGIDIHWDTTAGTMMSIGRSLVAFWLDPSLLRMLEPLRDEVGTELFRMLVAESSSHGTREDYDTMVTVFGDTFEEGFLAWGRAVGVVGWGKFEIAHLDRDTGTARVVVRSPWELVMQQGVEAKWGCPFMMGKMIGIFRHALGRNCWATERVFEEDSVPVVEISLFQSPITIEAELDRLRAELVRSKAFRLREEVQHQTRMHRASEERLRAVLSSINSWVFTLGPDGTITSHHLPVEPSPAYPKGELVGLTLSDVLPADAAAVLHAVAEEVRADSHVRSVEYSVTTGTRTSHFSAALSPLRDAAFGRTSVTVAVSDVTAQRQVAERQHSLEAQLHQAQKMEAIGQLTGGVAHDFNNLLTVIAGNLEMARTDVDDPEVLEFLEQATAAAMNAATLTHRLLAFARKQPLRADELDPHKLVSGMEVLLRRTLGERVDIEIIGTAGQWRCEADRSQLESAVLNLAINARDAMPGGGRLTIETANVRITPEYAESQEDVAPGQYTMVAVTDTGTGMSEEVQQKALDPFFTTKAVGRGSGLGLSMVYGFAKQSGGHLQLYSEPGVGTTVKLYLPRSTGRGSTQGEATWRGDVPAGDGSLILVVEDDAPVRHVSVRFLDRLGYRTIDCRTAEEALEHVKAQPDVALLFTDVVLAGTMNGVELAEEVHRQRPELPVLYTSGYTENALLHQRQSGKQLVMLEKPFTAEQLARRVHQALQRR